MSIRFKEFDGLNLGLQIQFYNKKVYKISQPKKTQVVKNIKLSFPQLLILKLCNVINNDLWTICI